jgi:nucleotide-binding universal stress UspA family protein
MCDLLSGVEPERVHVSVIASRSPAQGLHELAAADSLGLVIVGSTHTGSLGRVRPGSTGERLLVGAPSAVAVVPYGYRTRPDAPITRVGVAYDATPESRAALDAAIVTARALDASLQVITVIPTDVYGTPALMAGPSYIVVAGDVEEDIRKDLDAVVASVPADVPAHGVALKGHPWRELAEKSGGLDLLLVGSRGYGPLRAVLLGSTTGPLMREAQCPVIALPRGAEAGLAELFEVREAATA